MSAELYLSFVVATALLILFPGPSVMLTISHSLAWGLRKALLSVAGASAAIVVQLLVLAAGLSTVMLFAAQWFEAIRWAGVVYLIYLGLQSWRASRVVTADAAPQVRSGRNLFWQGFMVSLANPKSLFFYAAFFPHFVDPARPPGLQMLILGVTFLVIAAGLTAIYAALAHRIGEFFRGAHGSRVRLRLTGTVMIGAGVVLARARR